MAHVHTHGTGEEYAGYVAPPALRRLLTLIVLPLVLATVVGLLVLWPRGPGPSLGAGLGVAQDLVPAPVRTRTEVPCEGAATVEPGAPAADDVRCSLLELEITDGVDEGQTVALDYVETPRT